MAPQGNDKKIDNGYPFRDDILNFHLMYRGKKFYFEFPLLMDKSYLVNEIKSRTGVRGTFSIRWKEDVKQPKPNVGKQTKKEKPKRFADVQKEMKGEEICIHSSYITTESMKRFCGQTLTIIEGNESMISHL